MQLKLEGNCFSRSDKEHYFTCFSYCVYFTHVLHSIFPIKHFAFAYRGASYYLMSQYVYKSTSMQLVIAYMHESYLDRFFNVMQ